MTSAEFVEQFVDDCLIDGLSKPEDICSKAIAEIAEIDKTLEEYKYIRQKKNNLLQVLKTFNHDNGKTKSRKVRAPVINPDVQNVDENPAYKCLLIEICDIVENINGPVTTREVLDKTNYDTKDPTPLYQAMKWLFNSGILSQNADRTVDKGPNWSNRPVSEVAPESVTDSVEEFFEEQKAANI